MSFFLFHPPNLSKKAHPPSRISPAVNNKTLQGETRRAIVYHLNDHGIPSPTTYRKNKGLPYSCSVSDNPMWGDRVLTNILTNPIYTGDLVQGRRRVKSYKVHEIEAVPEDEWVRVADTHEAIIDRETFEKVQASVEGHPDGPTEKGAPSVQRFSPLCGLREIHYTEPEREKCVLRLLYLQIPLPGRLLHALNQA